MRCSTDICLNTLDSESTASMILISPPLSSDVYFIRYFMSYLQATELTTITPKSTSPALTTHLHGRKKVQAEGRSRNSGKGQAEPHRTRGWDDAFPWGVDSLVSDFGGGRGGKDLREALCRFYLLQEYEPSCQKAWPHSDLSSGSVTEPTGSFCMLLSFLISTFPTCCEPPVCASGREKY